MNLLNGKHAGPFELVAYGPRRTLATTKDASEVRDLARTFLTDPRDTIETVYVWSDSAAQMVATFRRDGKELEDRPTRIEAPAADVLAHWRAHHVEQGLVEREPSEPHAIVESPYDAIRAATPHPHTCKCQECRPVDPPVTPAVTTPSDDQKTCPYSGTRDLPTGVMASCPLCGAQRTPRPMWTRGGKRGPIIFPFHYAKPRDKGLNPS